MSDLIRVKRGLKADLPELMQGEMGYCTDTEELFIGGTDGNVAVSKKIPPSFVNVLDYGAKGDGITNDTIAIDNAIATGKSVLFPPGTYIRTTPLVTAVDGQKIVGVSKDLSIIKFNGCSGIRNFPTVGSATGWRPTIDLSDIHIMGDRANITDASNENWWNTALSTVAFAPSPKIGIEIYKFYYSSWKNVKISNFDVGVKINAGMDGLIEQLQVFECEIGVQTRDGSAFGDPGWKLTTTKFIRPSVWQTWLAYDLQDLVDGSTLETAIAETCHQGFRIIGGGGSAALVRPYCEQAYTGYSFAGNAGEWVLENPIKYEGAGQAIEIINGATVSYLKIVKPRFNSGKIDFNGSSGSTIYIEDFSRTDNATLFTAGSFAKANHIVNGISAIVPLDAQQVSGTLTTKKKSVISQKSTDASNNVTANFFQLTLASGDANYSAYVKIDGYAYGASASNVGSFDAQLIIQANGTYQKNIPAGSKITDITVSFAGTVATISVTANGLGSPSFVQVGLIATAYSPYLSDLVAL